MFHREILLCMSPIIEKNWANISTYKQGECVGKITLFSLHNLTKSQF